MSESRAEFNQAFADAQKEMPTIPKNRSATIKTNTGSYSYSYADLGDVLAAALPILHKHGLALSQSPVSEADRVGVETRLYHTSGHTESYGALLLPAGGTPQNAGSAMTYARRYAACAVLGIVADEDADGAQTPVREEPKSDGAAWLANAVEMFTEWTGEQRRETWAQVMDELELSMPISEPEAKKVHARMAEVYYEMYPPDDSAAPF